MKRRIHISIDPGLMEVAEKHMKARHFSQFSDYVEHLIRVEDERRAEEALRLQSVAQPRSRGTGRP